MYRKLKNSWHLNLAKGNELDKIKRGKNALSEIINQTNAWEETIRLVTEKAGSLKTLSEGIEEVVFTGCGSALNVAWVIAPTFQYYTGIKARAVPSADCVFFPDTIFTTGSPALVVPISRSGDTTETVMACEAAQARGMKTLSITCNPESQLAGMTTETLVLEPASEKAVVTTQSVTSMVLCGQMFAAIVSNNGEMIEQLKSLPAIGQGDIQKYHDLGRRIGENENITKFAFVGSGPYYGLARECQLKIKEMVVLPSDSYPVLDFRHGPKSNVDEQMLVTVLMSDSARDAEIAFLKDMKELNGIILVLCEKANPEISRTADYLVEVNSGLPEFVRLILYLPVIQFLSYYKSLLQGQDPDNPRKLSYYVALEGAIGS